MNRKQGYVSQVERLATCIAFQEGDATTIGPVDELGGVRTVAVSSGYVLCGPRGFWGETGMREAKLK